MFVSSDEMPPEVLDFVEDCRRLLVVDEDTPEEGVIALTKAVYEIKAKFFPKIDPALIKRFGLITSEYCPMCHKYMCNECRGCPLNDLGGYRCCFEWEMTARCLAFAPEEFMKYFEDLKKRIDNIPTTREKINEC